MDEVYVHNNSKRINESKIVIRYVSQNLEQLWLNVARQDSATIRVR